MSDPVQLERIDARVHGRYLVRCPPEPSGDVLVGFHGFGETCRHQMDELVRLPGLDSWTLVAIEALHPFYTRAGEVVASWMTRQDREMAIEENVAYVRAVLDRVAPGSDGGRLATIGFSQGTAMAYRTAAFSGRSISAVLALGGDVPPELAEVEKLPFDRVLIGRGLAEEWYGSNKLAGDIELLGRLGLQPEVLEFEGGHEWTDAFRDRAAVFLNAGR